MADDVKKLLGMHEMLVHSERKRVLSHVQRQSGDWIINTLVLDVYAVPFRFKRRKPYKNLNKMFVNLTYYPTTETVADIEVEMMNVVRIRTS
jgi:hypothetical protein